MDCTSLTATWHTQWHWDVLVIMSQLDNIGRKNEHKLPRSTASAIVHQAIEWAGMRQTSM